MDKNTFFFHHEGDPKKYKLVDIKSKKSSKTAVVDNTAKNSEFIKRNREEFRRSIVDIIMYFILDRLRTPCSVCFYLNFFFFKGTKKIKLSIHRNNNPK